MDRTAFLSRLRERLSTAEPAPTAPPLPATFPPTPASGTDASPERFLQALRAVAGEGELVPRARLADAVARVAATVSRDRRRAVVAPDALDFAAKEIEAGLALADVELLRPSNGAEWRVDAERAGLGVTNAALGVASTGSVLIASGADSPRATSILPESHLVILPADRLVPGLEEALDAVTQLADACSNPFLVTGPSRTSDIEMEMVLGAHGPRSVHVLLVTDR
jgi:L-lactate dehydrogenase complex protein LldG